MPLRERKLGGEAYVIEENVAHLPVHFAVVDKESGLEIVLEAAEVEVGRAHRHQILVDYQSLCVEHARVVEVDLYAGFQALCNKGE